MDFIKLLSLLGLTFIFSHCGNTPQIIYEEEYIYNEEGQLTAILVKETDKDTTSWTKDSFIYDSLKRKIAMERTSSRFKSTETTTYQYDSDGDTIAVKTTGGNDSFDKLFLYTYANKAGHKVIIETEQYHINDTKDTTLYSTIQYKYDSWLYWAERITFIYSPDSVSIVNEKHKFERNKYDNMSESIECYYKDGVLVKRWKTRCKLRRKKTENKLEIYDDIYETIFYSADEGTTVYHYKHYYWQDMKCKEVETTAIKEGVEVAKRQEKFDQDGRRTKDILTETKGNMIIKQTRTYTYDGSNKLVKITHKTYKSTE